MADISKEKIIEALAKLDTKNDAQWTGSGDPKMDVIESLVGTKEINRAQVKAAAPEFTRENPTLSKADSNQQGPNAGDGSQDDQAQNTSEDDLAQRKKTAKEEIDAARKNLDEARKEYDAATAKMDLIISEEQSETGKVTQAEMVKRYQKSQAELATKDAEKLKALGALMKKG